MDLEDSKANFLRLLQWCSYYNPDIWFDFEHQEPNLCYHWTDVLDINIIIDTGQQLQISLLACFRARNWVVVKMGCYISLIYFRVAGMWETLWTEYFLKSLAAHLLCKAQIRNRLNSSLQQRISNFHGMEFMFQQLLVYQFGLFFFTPCHKFLPKFLTSYSCQWLLP